MIEVVRDLVERQAARAPAPCSSSSAIRRCSSMRALAARAARTRRCSTSAWEKIKRAAPPRPAGAHPAPQRRGERLQQLRLGASGSAASSGRENSRPSADAAHNTSRVSAGSCSRCRRTALAMRSGSAKSESSRELDQRPGIAASKRLHSSTDASSGLPARAVQGTEPSAAGELGPSLCASSCATSAGPQAAQAQACGAQLSANAASVCCRRAPDRDRCPPTTAPSPAGPASGSA